MAADRDPVGELLGRLERPVAPPAPFKDDLKRRLLSELARAEAPRPEDAPMSTLRIPIDAGAVPALAPPRRAGPARAPARRWWRTVETVVAALLVLAIAGGTLLGSGGLPALLGWGQDDAPAGGTAMFLGNAARTGEMPGPGPAGEPGLRWRVPLAAEVGGTADSSPVVVDGAVYLATYTYDAAQERATSAFSAFDAATGRVRWSTPVDRLGYGGSPAVAGGLVYLGTTTLEREEFFGPGTPITEPIDLGALVALDAATGEERWSYPTEGSGGASPAVAEGMVYVGAEDGILHAVDAATGEGRWSFAVANAGELGSSSVPSVADGTVFVAGSRGLLHALDAATGQERWRVGIGGNQPTTPIVSDGTVYISATDVPPADETDGGDPGGPPPDIGRLVALDAASGAERWAIDFAVDLRRYLDPDPAVAGDLVYLAGVGADGAEVRALDTATGRQRWVASTGAQVGTAPAVADGVVYVGGDAVHALDAAGGDQRWRIETGGANPWGPFVAGGAVFVASTDGNLYAIGGTETRVGTPAATPATDGDVSGLPPCDVEPRPELEVDAAATPPAALDRLYVPPVTGTPVASVVPVTEAQEEGQPAAILPEDVPAGEPADAEAIAGIAETLEHLAACSRPGRERQIAAFYSDDHFRRPAVATSLRYNGYGPSGMPEGSNLPLEDVRLLPDGRVGVLDQYTEESATFLVFVEQDGRWLIDEVVAVSNNPDARG